jgi:hypothetical protein
MASAPEISLKDQTFDQASKLSLAEQLDLAMTILKGLKKAVGGKKAAAEPAEPKEKKPLTPAMAAWHAGLKAVREAVQAAADPKFSLKNTMSVAKALRVSGNWPEPSKEAILEAYAAWKDGASSAGSAASSVASSVASSQPSKASKASAAAEAAAAAGGGGGGGAAAGGSTSDDEKQKREAKIAKMKASLAAKRAAAAAGDPLSAMSGEELRQKYESLTGKKKPSGKFTTKSALVDEIKRLEAGTSDLEEAA